MAVYQTLSITQLSQDVQQNCSKIRVVWKSTQTGASYNMVEATGIYTLYVNGQEHMENIRYVLPKQTEQIILDREETVFHDSKGEALIEVETWMDTKISAGVVKLYEKLQLDTLPRVSELRASDCMIGDATRLAVTRKNNTFSHSIAWQFGSQSGYIGEDGSLCQEEERYSRESLDVQIPDSFYEEIPNDKSGICTLTIRTYSGDSLIGEPSACQFKVFANEKECGPTFYGSVVDTNEKTVALTGDERVLVRHISNARIFLYGTARKGAQIVKKTVQGREIQGEYLDVPNFRTEAVTVSVTDSRGFTKTGTLPVYIVDYVPLTCEAAAKRLGPVTGRAELTVAGDYFNGSFEAVENDLSLSYSVNGGEWIPLAFTVTEDNRYTATAILENMDYTKVFNIQVRAEDKLSNLEKRVILKKGIPVFDWGEQDFAFHVPVRMEEPLALQYGGTGACDRYGAWENLGLSPKMEPGVEYETCEMWQGERVYTQIVEYGPMPNQSCYGIVHHCRARIILRCTGCTSDGRTLPYGGIHGSRVDVYCSLGSVYIDAQNDESAHTAWVQIYYIK